MNEMALREEMVSLSRSLYERGYAAGGTGNLSVRIDQQRILATPTGSCLGRLKAEELSVVDTDGNHLSGMKPSKEVKFHLALYADDSCGAVVHLHSTWTTLLSCRADIDPEEIIRPFTPYYVMKAGTVELIRYYPPGDIALAEELGRWAGKRHAFLLQNHGPVVTGGSLSVAMDLMEEFEETAKLAYLLRNENVRYLSEDEVAFLRKR
ncbi:MAG: aldolase [Sphaerochaetaceae bacterium]|nr:aldolase [Sphaerochaetaceae bacterium]